MSQKKVQKSYIDYGFGFPVQLLNAPFKKVREEWVLDLNFEKYEKAVLMALVLKPARLTGNEVRFIRHHFEMDLKAFGKRFGDVAHSAVIKWEKFSDQPTNMNWATEKDIRLAITDKLNPKSLRRVYENLEKVAESKPHQLKIDPKEMKVA
jgi:DNA-binding transcriptional regulator YiaG